MQPEVTPTTLRVQAGAVLTIEPGVTVLATSGAGLHVRDTLIAKGTGSDVVAGTDMHISANNIYNNRRFSVKVTGNKDVTLDAANNYWGAGIAGPGIPLTMDACGFDPSAPAPCVTFKPYLTSPSTVAPPVPTPR